MTNTLTPTQPGQVLKLTPKIHPLVQDFINQPNQLFDLVDALGSPLNFLFPEMLSENLKAFYSVFTKLNLRGKVYFAHKANRSDSLTWQLSFEDASIDVSSINELRHALSCGFDATRIQATGPKNTEFLVLSLKHNIVISIDSFAELEEIIRLKKRFGLMSKTQILLRVSGFKSTHSQYRTKASRFGIPLEEVPEAFELLKKNQDLVILKGFAFHVDTVSIPEKAIAIENCIELFEEAISHGFEPSVINIGGGFKVNYLAHGNDWHQYTAALRDAALGTRQPITWHGNTFGLIPDKSGSLRGNFNSYSYYDPTTGPSFLEELLMQPLVAFDEASASSIMAENGIELWIEPGRALLDQAGITVSRVNSVRHSSKGDILVCLNMKRQDVCFLDQEIFIDPIVIYRDGLEKKKQGEYTPVYFAGNLCLENDLVCRHQTYLPTIPKAGDLVIFPNTAGYFMDFSASESIMQPIARKVAIFRKEGKFAWSLDDQYFPWLSI